MTPREDELYSKVIEIAQEQAASQSAMTELHRQNVAKADAALTLLSAQTTSLLGVNNALNHLNEAMERSDRANAADRAAVLQAVRDHVTEEIAKHKAEEDKRWGDMRWKFWVALAVIALSGSSETVARILGVLKG